MEKFLAQSRCSVNIWWMNESSFQETVFKIQFPLLKAACGITYFSQRVSLGFSTGAAEKACRPSLCAESACPALRCSRPPDGSTPSLSTLWHPRTHRFKYPVELCRLSSWAVSGVNLGLISLSWCDASAPIFHTMVSFPLLFSVSALVYITCSLVSSSLLHIRFPSVTFIVLWIWSSRPQSLSTIYNP